MNVIGFFANDDLFRFVIAGGQAFGVAFYLDGSVYNNPWDLANMPMPMPVP
jgi:hypothetical protein